MGQSKNMLFSPTDLESENSSSVVHSNPSTFGHSRVDRIEPDWCWQLAYAPAGESSLGRKGSLSKQNSLTRQGSLNRTASLTRNSPLRGIDKSSIKVVPTQYVELDDNERQSTFSPGGQTDCSSPYSLPFENVSPRPSSQLSGSQASLDLENRLYLPLCLKT